MDIAVEMSLYPLEGNYIPPIAAFIERLNRHPGLKVVTNSLSTQVFGEYDVVMKALHEDVRTAFEGEHKAVLVMKVLGPMPAA